MYVCTSKSFNNFITSLITFNTLIQHGAYIHDQNYQLNGKITIAHCEDYPSTTAKMDISSIYQISFVCRLCTATCIIVSDLCATYLVCVCCMHWQFVCSIAQCCVVRSVLLCSSICTFMQYVCSTHCTITVIFCNIITLHSLFDSFYMLLKFFC